MNHEEEQLLAELLRTATDRAIATNRFTNETMSIRQFQVALAQQRPKILPEVSLSQNHPDYYNITIQGEEVQQKLTNLVEKVLQGHIHNGKVQTAAVSIFGGLGSGHPITHLIQKMVRVAILKGPEQVANDFRREIQEQVATYQWTGLLNGIRIEQPIEVRPGINMIPLPNSARQSNIIHPMTQANPADLEGLTIISVDHTITPIYADPSLLLGSFEPFDEFFKHDQKHNDLPDFNMGKFCDALALACNGPVETILTYHKIEQEEIFLLGTPVPTGHTIHPDGMKKRKVVQATEEQVEEAVSIYKTLSSLKEGDGQKLEVPIKRWIKSKTDQSLEDSFIDIGIALESLYLDGSHQELGFRLRLRAALFLEENPDERVSLMKDIRTTYGLRSDAVHEGIIKHSEDNRTHMKRAQELCRESIIKTINHAGKSGRLPNWDRLELGQLNEESDA